MALRLLQDMAATPIDSMKVYGLRELKEMGAIDLRDNTGGQAEDATE